MDRSHRGIRLIVFSIALYLLFPPTAFANDQDDTLDFVIEKNALSRAQIKSISFRFEMNTEGETKGGGGRFTTHLSVGVIQQGEQKWATQEINSRQADGHANASSTRAVVNNKYAAFSLGGHPIAEQFDLEANGKLGKAATNRAHLYLPPDIFLFAFGTGAETLQVVRAKLPEYFTWRIEEETGSSGTKVYKITQFVRASVPRPWRVIIVEPLQGYLVTSVDSYVNAGIVGKTIRITNQMDVSANLWFPKSIEEETYDVWDQIRPSPATTSAPAADPKVVQRTVIQLSNVKLNVPVDEQKFTLKALELDPSVVIAHATTHGRNEVLQIYEGEYIPEDLIPNRKEASHVTARESSGPTTAPIRKSDKQVISVSGKSAVPYVAIGTMSIGIVLVSILLVQKRTKKTSHQ